MLLIIVRDNITELTNHAGRAQKLLIVEIMCA